MPGTKAKWEMKPSCHGKGGSSRLLVPDLSPELMKSSHDEAVDWNRTGHWRVKGRPDEAAWTGEEEEIFFKIKLQKAGNYFEIIMPKTMPVLEEEGYKHRWETDIVVSGLWDSDKFLPCENTVKEWRRVRKLEEKEPASSTGLQEGPYAGTKEAEKHFSPGTRI